MDALRDQSWMRELYLSVPAERFDWDRFSVVATCSEPSDEHHYNRYRYRLFFFEKSGPKPVMAVSMESDILGDWSLTVMTASGTRIVSSFDAPPDYETFKAIALEAAGDADTGPAPGKPEPRRASRPRRRLP